MTSAIIVRVDKNQRLRCVWEGSSYVVRVTEIGRGRKRYVFGPTDAPISCTREVNKYLAHARAQMEGGNDDYLSELPEERITAILDSLDPSSIVTMRLTNKALKGKADVYLAHWRAIAALPRDGTFQTKITEMSNRDLTRLKSFLPIIDPLGAQNDNLPAGAPHPMDLYLENVPKNNMIDAELARRAA